MAARLEALADAADGARRDDAERAQPERGHAADERDREVRSKFRRTAIVEG